MKNRSCVSPVRTFVLVGACAFATAAAFAATRTYVGPENGKWNVAENWQDEGGATGVPQTGDTLRVSEYWLNGVKQGPGSYVLGSGSVKVLGGGLIMIFR